jgi:hypothetical protein
MKTRVGKIARLPKVIREELNRRLEDGALGTEMVAWLNGLPEVQCILAEQFGGRLISNQNLSDWRHGGYHEWVFSRDSRIQLREMMDEAQSLNQSGASKDGKNTSSHLGTFMLVELAEVIDRLHHTKDQDKRWDLLRKISLELSRLRAAECREKSLRLKQLKANAAQPDKGQSN